MHRYLKRREESPSGPLWCRRWCPLLQGLCCNSRKQVRTTAITYLQRSLLVHDLQSLTAGEWESYFYPFASQTVGAPTLDGFHPS